MRAEQRSLRFKEEASIKVSEQVARPAALTGLYREIILLQRRFPDSQNAPFLCCHIRRS